MINSINLKKVFSAAALVSLSVFSFVNAAETRFPGVFISDTENRWHVAEYEYEDEAQFGYVICDGGYIGSPLIPNSKKTVDEFLGYCKTGKRVGPGKLPVIDVADNHNKNASSYLAYETDLNGRTYYLCKGYLNSTKRCSYQADKEVARLVDEITNSDNPEIASLEVDSSLNQPDIDLIETSATQIVDLDKGFEQSTPTITQRFDKSSIYPRQAQAEEIVNEISSTINSRPSGLSRLNLQGIDLRGAKVISLNPTTQSIGAATPSISQKQGIEITQQELEALKAGRISLTELTEGRTRVNLNSIANNSGAQQLQTVPLSAQSSLPNSVDGRQAIRLTAQELDALQNGRVSLEQLTASKPIVNVGSDGSQIVSAPSQVNGKQAVQVTAAELQALSSGQLSLNDLIQNRPMVDVNSPNQGVAQIPISSQLANAVTLSPQQVQPSQINSNSPAQPQTVVKAVPITRETLTALQSGQISLEQVVSGNPNFSLLDFPQVQVQSQQIQPQVQQLQAPINIPAGPPTLAQQVASAQLQAMPQAQQMPPQQIQQPNIAQPNLIPSQASGMQMIPQGQIAPQDVQQPMPQQLPPQQLAIDPNMQAPQMQNPQQQFAPEIPQSLTNPQYGAFVPANQGYGQMQDPMFAQGQQMFQPNMQQGMMPTQDPSMMLGMDPYQQQMLGMQQPMQYGTPAISPMLQAQNNNFMMSGYPQSPYDFPVMNGMQSNPNAMNYPQGAMPGGYSSLGAPVTYVTTPVYSTHSNAQYFPGAVGL